MLGQEDDKDNKFEYAFQSAQKYIFEPLWLNQKSQNEKTHIFTKFSCNRFCITVEP